MTCVMNLSIQNHVNVDCLYVNRPIFSTHFAIYEQCVFDRRAILPTLVLYIGKYELL